MQFLNAIICRVIILIGNDLINSKKQLGTTVLKPDNSIQLNLVETIAKKSNAETSRPVAEKCCTDDD